MKKSTTTCKISSPCHKLDGKIDRKAASNYCASCNKEVLNLLELSEQQILQNLNSYQGNCVSVQASKLQSVNRKINLHKLSKAAIFAGAISLLTPSCHRMALANEAHDQEKEKNRYGSKLLEAKPIAEDELVQEHLIIKGRIQDYGKEPIIAAQIAIKGLDYGVITDINGNFILIIPKEIADSMKIEVTYTGYMNFTVTLQDLLNKEVLIQLGEDPGLIGYLDITELLRK